MISGGPPNERPPRGGRPLDPDRPNPDNARPDAEAPSGLLAQLAATRAAAIRLVRAHVDLAIAEANEIKGEVLRTIALGGLAAASLVLVAFLLSIGLFLFLGEWLFGSLGWGVLMGAEFLVAVAVFGVLAALRSSGLARAVGIAVALGVVVSVVFGTNVLNTIYRQVAAQFATPADPGDISFLYGAAIGAAVLGIVGLLVGARGGSGSAAAGGLIAGVVVGALLGVLTAGLVRLAINPDSRPMVVGILLWAVGGGLAGLVAGWRVGAGEGAATGMAIGIVAGGLFGAFSAITFAWHVAIAIGIAVALGVAPALAGAFAASGGIDIEALKARYIPQTTIDTTKETIEWAQARMPGGRS
jgi:hypothetical protein